MGIDPGAGTVFEVDAFPSENQPGHQFIITDPAAAQRAALALYRRLQAPADYQLIGVQQGHGGDFWNACWEKEVLPGVFSRYQSVNLTLFSDTGKLWFYRLFNTPDRSLTVKVTKDQAVATAKPLAVSKGFPTLLDAKLDVEQANNCWSSQGPAGPPGYCTLGQCTLAWAVTCQDAHGARALFYVDAATGSLIGGDQTK